MRIFNRVNLFWKIGVVVLLTAVAALGARFLSGDEDTWLCQNGEWVKHGNPSAAQPTAACLPTGQAGGQPADGSISTTTSKAEIEVFAPLAGQTITSPLVITGRARGNWFFEASFPVELVEDSGAILASGIAQLDCEECTWMTTEFVPFAAKLEFNSASRTTAASGKLILKKDNPSGLPQYDAQIEIPVLISYSQTTTVKTFFSNNNLDKEITCNKVFFVDRSVAETQAVARAALDELLKGPTAEEKAQGYFTSINPGVKIQKLTITNGTAKVDFDETMEEGMGGSCRVSAIRAQITETLKQFSTVKNVIISVNGRTEDILQP